MKKHRQKFFAWAATCLLGAALFAAVAVLSARCQRPSLVVSLDYHPGPLAPELRVTMANRGRRPVDLPSAWQVLSIPPGPYGDIHEFHLLPRSGATAPLPPARRPTAPTSSLFSP